MKILMLGIDLGKNLCSLAGMDQMGAVVLRRRLKRETLLRFTARLEVCTVAMRAAGRTILAGRSPSKGIGCG